MVNNIVFWYYVYWPAATSDSSSTNDIPGAVDGGGGVEDEPESLLKLPKVPFAMDLDVHSNRSSVISQVIFLYFERLLKIYLLINVWKFNSVPIVFCRMKFKSLLPSVLPCLEVRMNQNQVLRSRTVTIKKLKKSNNK